MPTHQYEQNTFVWGTDCTERSRDLLEEHGCSNVLVICGENTRASGIVDTVIDRLGNTHVGTFDGVKPNTPLETVREGVERKRTLDADAVLSIGGGSAVDTAKAISILDGEETRSVYEMRAEVIDREIKTPELMAEKIPVFSVVTTLSAAEISNVCGVTDPDGGTKMVLIDDAVRPAICFYDGALAVTTPSDVFAETGMAAFDHAVEVLSSSETGSNPLYQATAERALQLLREHLPIAYREDDQEAVQYSLLGAAMSGLGATNVCINHGINHALCARHPVSHGEGNGILLPHGIRFNFEAVPDRIRQIGRALGLQTDSIANDAILEAVVQEVHAIQDELDMPDRLRDVGVEKDDFEGTAKVAITDPAMANNPRQVNESDIVNILEAAW